MEPERLTLKQAGERLGLSRTAVRNLIDAGELAAEVEVVPRTGTARRTVSAQEVEALLQQRRAAAAVQSGPGRPLKLPEEPDSV